MLQTMNVGVERVKDTKVLTLKSEFEAICMKDGESIDEFFHEVDDDRRQCGGGEIS